MLAKSLTAAVLCLLATSAAAYGQEASPADDPVVAIVDGVPVHRAEVEAVVRTLPAQMRQMPLQILYDTLLDRVIDFRLLSNQAEQSDLADDPAVERALALARAAVLRDSLVQQAIEQGTTEAELQERYEQKKKEAGFAHEEVHARHILVPSEDEAKSAIEELAGGADFAKVAEARSTGPSGPGGGDLGFIRREQVVPEFGEAAFALQPGETSKEPVQTQFGWHVINVLERRNVEPTFADTEPQLREELAREIVTALVEDLRTGAKIEKFNMDGSPMTAEPEAAQPGAAPEAKPEAE